MSQPGRDLGFAHEALLVMLVRGARSVHAFHALLLPCPARCLRPSGPRPGRRGRAAARSDSVKPLDQPSRSLPPLSDPGSLAAPRASPNEASPAAPGRRTHRPRLEGPLVPVVQVNVVAMPFLRRMRQAGRSPTSVATPPGLIPLDLNRNHVRETNLFLVGAFQPAEDEKTLARSFCRVMLVSGPLLDWRLL